jgi:protein ImuB
MALASSRRIAAVVLPELLCELARASFALSGKKPLPLGVVMTERLTEQPSANDLQRNGEDENDVDREPLKATALLDAVSESAQRYGVRQGQSIAEACAVISNLCVREVKRREVLKELGRIAEVALGYGATVSLEAPDTVWVDISGSAHLFGGEAVLASELAASVRALGHVVRVAVASGPILARAFARWSPPSPNGATSERGVVVVPGAHTAARLTELPITALPIVGDHASWFVRVGVITVGDLAALPRAATATRLGDGASQVLDLCEGRDSTPLAAYHPPRTLVEEASFEEPVDGVEPLAFVLRGLAARLSARLAGRGEAAQALRLVVLCDRSVARLRGASDRLELDFDLATPLWREEELRRVVASRLERARLEAPSVGLRLEAPHITEAASRQLDLSRVAAGLTGSPGVEVLPVLVAELTADVGRRNVGLLRVVDAHRPEKKSELVATGLKKATTRPSTRSSAQTLTRRSLRKTLPRPTPWVRAPTRLLPKPVPFEAAIRRGATLSIDRRLYTIEHVVFEHRLEGVEWWTKETATRDYLRVILRSNEGLVEALVYVDRQNGRRFLHAVAD